MECELLIANQKWILLRTGRGWWGVNFCTQKSVGNEKLLEYGSNKLNEGWRILNSRPLGKKIEKPNLGRGGQMPWIHGRSTKGEHRISKL